MHPRRERRKALLVRCPQAYLNAGLRISLFDERAEPGAAPLTFEHRGGIGEYVDHICEGKRPLFEVPSATALTPTATAATSGCLEGVGSIAPRPPGRVHNPFKRRL